MSALVHDTVFKLEKSRSEEVQTDPTLHSIGQVDDAAAEVVPSRNSSAAPESAPTSLKRKRTEDESEILSQDVTLELDASQSPISSDRPTKRLRSSLTVGGVARSAATAAGYTSLGAVLTWAALAYV